MEEALRKTKEQKELYKLLMIAHKESNMAYILEEKLMAYMVPSDKKNLTARDLYKNRCIVDGLIGIWRKWLEDDCKADEQMLAELVKSLLTKL